MKDLAALVASAAQGSRAPLYAHLARGSRLPGVRPNMDLAREVAQRIAGLGAPAEALALEMAGLGADVAQGGTAREFLPVCGVLALGALAAASDTRARVRPMDALHDAAEDLRFRVRDAVPLAVAEVGSKHPEWTLARLAGWMDGFFHAAAALRAAAEPDMLRAVREPEPLVARLEEAFALLEEAPRAAARYPGHKALLDAVAACVPALAGRFPEPVVRALEALATRTADPVVREVAARAARACKRSEGARVLAALEATAPPRRDPRTDVGPTRRRGRRRG